MGNIRKYAQMMAAANMPDRYSEGNMRMGYAESRMYNEGGSTHGNRSVEREYPHWYNDGQAEDPNNGGDRMRRGMYESYDNIENRRRMEGTNGYEDQRTSMAPIGFRGNNNMRMRYSLNTGYSPQSSMQPGGKQMRSRGGASGSQHMSQEMAEEWVSNMKNEDGSKGPHFSMEQVKKVAEQRGDKFDIMKLWVAMNALYSDYCVVLHKYGLNMIDAYYDMAKAFIMDEDAVPDKLEMYYECIVKH